MMMTHTFQDFQELFASIFGSYSISLHIMVIAFAAIAMSGLAWLIAKARGQSDGLAYACIRDVLLGFLSIMLIFTAPVGLFLWGRAFWNATTARG